MNLRKTLLYNTLGLPAYWRQCRKSAALLPARITSVAYGPSARQYAMVLTPSEVAVRPGHHAFYFHGGAWTFGTPEKFLAAALPWLQQGYRVVLPSYRRPPAVGLHRIVADCKAAIKLCLKDEEVTELQLGGISAGAHLAASLTLDQQLWDDLGLSPTAVLCCAGPLNFGILRPRPLFLPRYADIDPYQQLNHYVPQATRWLLLHGTADATVALQHATSFTKKLGAKQPDSQLLIVPDGTHLDSGRWMFGGFGATEVAEFIARSPAP
ncbi:MAG: alpha/beta hydrolase [Bacteroidota bacterium]